MKTSLEKIQDEFGCPIEIGLEGIAKAGSILPRLVEDNGKIVEVTLCDSISGGANEVNNMPKTLSLITYKWVEGELHEFRGTYTLIENK